MKTFALALLVSLAGASASAHEGHHQKPDGAQHASCAQKCIEKGNPVGLLADGILYAVIMSDHESPNAKLAPFAGKLVTVTGKTLEKNGMHAIDLESIALAPATK
jgi:hypothetical protein